MPHHRLIAVLRARSRDQHHGRKRAVARRHGERPGEARAVNRVVVRDFLGRVREWRPRFLRACERHRRVRPLEPHEEPCATLGPVAGDRGGAWRHPPAERLAQVAQLEEQRIALHANGRHRHVLDALIGAVHGHQRLPARCRHELQPHPQDHGLTLIERAAPVAGERQHRLGCGCGTCEREGQRQRIRGGLPLEPLAVEPSAKGGSAFEAGCREDDRRVADLDPGQRVGSERATQHVDGAPPTGRRARELDGRAPLFVACAERARPAAGDVLAEHGRR